MSATTSGILGALVASNSVIALVVGGLFFLVAYFAIVLAEENFLRGKFGQAYDRYCDEVPRFAIKWGGLAETFRNSRFNWGRLLVKEYGTIFTSLAGIPLIVLLVRHFRYHLSWFADGWDAALFAVIVSLAAAYLCARWLKKSGRVTDLPQSILA